MSSLIVSCVLCLDTGRNISIFLSIFPSQEAAESNDVTSHVPFLQTRQAEMITHASHYMISSAFTSIVALLLKHSKTLKFLSCEAQNHSTHSTQGEAAPTLNTTNSFDQLVMLHLVAPDLVSSHSSPNSNLGLVLLCLKCRI